MAQRAKIEIKGIVQGVGFRPFVYNLAESLRLNGYVTNTSDGVTIEIEGEDVQNFLKRLTSEAPPLSRIVDIAVSNLPLKGYKGFSIIESIDNGRFTLISPDVSICDDCLRELYDPKDRRYLYPFINCTNCGPRYSITRSVPYDRPNTTMSVFEMCDDCRREYNDPKDRRFHAQPIACPVCGPKVELKIVNPLYKGNFRDPIKGAIELLKNGAILAIKGLGGFHIACDARNAEVVGLLRQRKRKSNKPFALMAPDIERVSRYCYCSDVERDLLMSRKRPIVLLRKREENRLPRVIAPDNNYLGFMLPYTPLHYLLFLYPDFEGPCPSNSLNNESSIFNMGFGAKPQSFEGPCPSKSLNNESSIFNMGFGALPQSNDSVICHFDALIMTSGNLSEEPIERDNKKAMERLSELVDAFLIHNRDIFMRVDDSVVRVNRLEKENSSFPLLSFIRRSRGFVPEPIDLYDDGPDVLGCGADLKNTFTITKGRFAILGQHIGDMENYETLAFFEESLRNIRQIYRAEPVAIAHDLHPNYLSTQWASRQGVKGLMTYGIQHHYAHIASVMAERNLKDRVIGVALDGTGYGTDGYLWGGEFLIADIEGFIRPLHFRYIPLLGGERAIKETWRMAVSYIMKSTGEKERGLYYLKRIGLMERFGGNLMKVIELIDKRDFSPLSSGAGRLFDSVSAILGLCYTSTFEGEAAIALESLVRDDIEDAYEFIIGEDIDLSSCIRGILNDIENNVEKSIIATKFHNTVSSVILHAVRRLSELYNIGDVVLSGGTFQNHYLLKRTIKTLDSLGFSVYINEKVPCNDGGISLGQAYILRERLKRGIDG